MMRRRPFCVLHYAEINAVLCKATMENNILYVCNIYRKVSAQRAIDVI